MRRKIWDMSVALFGIAAALAIFYGLFCAFIVMARDADLREDVRRSEAVVEAAAYAPAAEDAEEAAERYTLYREGDGPAPEWYDPDGPMAAEWYADDQACDSQCTDGLQSDYILDVPLDENFQIYLHGLCEEYGVPYTLAIAVIEAESTYRADVISATNDYGLMQINQICHDWLRSELGIEDFLDAMDNVRAGVYILGQYYRLYGAVSGTLVAYNRGQASAEAMFAAGVYETAYSRRVMEIQRRLEDEGR